MNASRLTRTIEDLCRRDTDYQSAIVNIVDAVGAYLKTPLGTLVTLDPVALLPTSVYMGSTPPIVPAAIGRALARVFNRRDLDWKDPLSVRVMVQSNQRVTSRQTADWSAYSGQRTMSKIFLAHAMADEIRLLLTHGDQVWGAMAIASRKATFTTEQMSVLSSIGPTIGDGLRIAFLRAALRKSGMRSGPAVVPLGEDGTLGEAGPAAVALIGAVEPGIIPAWLITLQLRADTEVTPSTVLMTENGQVTAHLTTLGAQTVVILERSRTLTLASRVLRAHGLTPRQRQVVEGMCAGWDTRRIAFELDAADATITKHMRGIYKKLGVANRQELLSYLLTHDHLPQHQSGAIPSPYGGYLD